MRMMTRNSEGKEVVCVWKWVSFVVAAVGAGSCYVEVSAAEPAKLRPASLPSTLCLKLSGYSAHFLSSKVCCTAVLAVSLSDATGWCGSWRRRKRSARDGALKEADTRKVSAMNVFLAFITPFGHVGGYLPWLDAPLVPGWRATWWSSG